MGDFNETSCMEERIGSSDDLCQRCFIFNRWIDEMELLDMGFSGSKFTWNRGSNPATRTSARLNRGLCNLQWRSLFPQASIRHLATNQSDHSPLLLSFNGFGDICTPKRPFRFQAAWMLHLEFQEFLVTHWDNDMPLSTALSNLETNLDSWNKMVFGNLFLQKERLWRRIEGVQHRMATQPCRGLMKLESKLRKQLDVQKARSDAIIDGDRNAKYFHSCTIVRRKQNKLRAFVMLLGNGFGIKMKCKRWLSHTSRSYTPNMTLRWVHLI
ncbi:hypothetical protein V2J09_005794 [Rumex salicifolius]